MTKQSEEKSEQKNPGLLRRMGGGAGRYLIKRTATAKAVGMIYGGMKGNAKTAFHVEKLDPEQASKGFHGAYEDGGRESFASFAAREGLSDSDIKALSAFHKTHSMVFLAGMMFFFAIVIFYFIQGHVWWGFVYLPVTMTFGAMSFRHAFTSWQARERRFGSISEFLKT